jgi:hypothetical protein
VAIEEDAEVVVSGTETVVVVSGTLAVVVSDGPAVVEVTVPLAVELPGGVESPHADTVLESSVTSEPA